MIVTNPKAYSLFMTRQGFLSHSSVFCFQGDILFVNPWLHSLNQETKTKNKKIKNIHIWNMSSQRTSSTWSCGLISPSLKSHLMLFYIWVMRESGQVENVIRDESEKRDRKKPAELWLAKSQKTHVKTENVYVFLCVLALSSVLEDN